VKSWAPAQPTRPRAKTRGPKRGRKQGSFGTHRRLSKLRDALDKQPNGLTLEEIADALSVTTRSVRRYLVELGRWGAELESIETAPGGAHLWRIKPSERGRAITMRRTQAYALLATRRQFDALKGSALYDEIDLVMRQLVTIAQRPTKATARGEIAVNTRLEERLLFLPDAPRRYDARAEELDALFHAVADLRVITCALADKRATVLQPYALLFHRGIIWCVAHSPSLKDARVIAFDEMRDIDVAAEHFALPDNFDVNDYVHGDFGIAAPPKARDKIRVLVEFDPRIAHEVRVRKCHPSQRVAIAQDGRVRVSLTLGDLDAATRWVLGFGDGARVIEPVELVLSVETALKKILAKYT
jgi:predicted DNA-binding transcriptional regulator YafY